MSKCLSAWFPWRNSESRLVLIGKSPQSEKMEDSEIDKSWFNGLKEIFILIPGNPGPAEFYEPFMESLYKSLSVEKDGLTMCAISHAGHDTRHKKWLPTEDTYILEDQIQHKIDFIQQFIDHKTRVILIGHSIGCKVIKEIFKRNQDHHISDVYFLFPTIENMMKTDRGKEVHLMTTHFRLPLIWTLTVLLAIIPKFVFRFLVRRYLSDSSDAIHKAVFSLANSNHVNNSLVMARDELEIVNDLDKEAIKNMVGKLRVYYGLTDGWCPLTFRDNLLQVEGMDESIAVVDSHGMEHAFVMRDGHKLGEVVAHWMLNGTVHTLV